MFDQIVSFILYNEVLIVTLGSLFLAPRASSPDGGSSSAPIFRGVSSSSTASISGAVSATISAISTISSAATNVTLSSGLFPTPTITATATATIIETTWQQTMTRTVYEQVVVPPSFMSDYFIQQPTTTPTPTPFPTCTIGPSELEASEWTWTQCALVFLCLLVIFVYCAFLGVRLQFEATQETLRQITEEHAQKAGIIATNVKLHAKLKADEQRLLEREADARAQVKDLSAAEAKLDDERKATCLQVLDMQQRVRYLETAARGTALGSGTSSGQPDQVKALCDALHAADSTITELRQDLVEVIAANDNGLAINDGLEQRFQTLVREKDAAISALREEVASLTASRPASSVEATLETFEEELAWLRKASEKDLAALQEREARIVAQSRRIEALTSEGQSTRHALQEFEATIQAQYKRIEVLTSESQSTIDTLRVSLDIATAAHADATSTVAALQRELETTNADALRDEIVRLRTQLSATSADAAILASLQAQNAALQRRLGETDREQELHLARASRTALAELDSLKNSNQHLTDQLVSASTKHMETANKLAALKKQNQVLTDYLTSTSTTLTATRDDHMTFKEQIDQAFREWQDLKTRMEVDVMARDAHIAELRAANERWQAHKESWDVAIASRDRDIAELGSRLAAKEQQKVEWDVAMAARDASSVKRSKEIWELQALLEANGVRLGEAKEKGSKRGRGDGDGEEGVVKKRKESE